MVASKAAGVVVPKAAVLKPPILAVPVKLAPKPEVPSRAGDTLVYYDVTNSSTMTSLTPPGQVIRLSNAVYYRTPDI